MGLMFIFFELNKPSLIRFPFLPTIIWFCVFVIPPIGAGIFSRYILVRPVKAYFDNDYHVITLMLNDSPTQEIVYVGSLNETIEAFNELKQLYQKSKLKQ